MCVQIDIDQLLKIMRLCGTPDEEFMKKITSQEARNYINTLQPMKKKIFRDEFPTANSLGMFFVFVLFGCHFT